ncbi:MAG: hypothetical protein IIC75_06960, partial [Bacteroidetes bacterium]|nr:hypothetical protein [Bacteroidota bacterium]
MGNNRIDGSEFGQSISVSNNNILIEEYNNTNVFNTTIKDQLSNQSIPIVNRFGKFVPITGNVKELYKFFRALKGSRTNKIRIAHYGDSILLGDVITENLRQNFQRKFNGDGIGFLSIVPDDIRMKRTISQTFSYDWERGSLSKGNPKRFPIGISGLTARAKSNSWIKLKTTKFMKTSRTFKTARIFYSGANSSSSIEYSLGGSKFKIVKLKSSRNINQLILTSFQNVLTLEIKFRGAKGVFFYGISLENGNGIYVDNFPLTGNSGVSLTKIKKQTLKDFNKLMNYKLIIIKFGYNASELS